MAGLITGGYDVSDLGDFAGHLVYFTICWMYFIVFRGWKQPDDRSWGMSSAPLSKFKLL